MLVVSKSVNRVVLLGQVLQFVNLSVPEAAQPLIVSIQFSDEGLHWVLHLIFKLQIGLVSCLHHHPFLLLCILILNFLFDILVADI